MKSEELTHIFSQVFPDAGRCAACRVPGRVNLIGEHLDYNGLPVFPIATAQGITCLFAPVPGNEVLLRNLDPKYAPRQFHNVRGIPAGESGDWSNYCRAAIAGLNRLLTPPSLPGMALLFNSDLPVASGLSSSSSLVVATALAYLRVLGVALDTDISRLKLAQILAEAEQYVGTRGGGMDQAVILNAIAGHAAKIDFFPLRIEHVPLPEDIAIFVCDSGVRAEKSGTARARYNAGPLLCRVICALIERQLREEIDEDFVLPRLGDFFYGPLCLTQREAGELASRAIPAPLMTLQMIAGRLQLGEDEVRSRYLQDLPAPPEGFPLQARLRHVFSEFRRVEQFRDALLDGALVRAGQLMYESHQSCAEDYGISVPGLDALVEAARGAGALGARLTGAGFGGSTVNWVGAEAVRTYMEKMSFWCSSNGLNPDASLCRMRASEGAVYLV